VLFSNWVHPTAFPIDIKKNIAINVFIIDDYVKMLHTPLMPILWSCVSIKLLIVDHKVFHNTPQKEDQTVAEWELVKHIFSIA
jgi:hypothetical protein